MLAARNLDSKYRKEQWQEAYGNLNTKVLVEPAAEILLHYNGGFDGYSDEDFYALVDMLLNVVYPVIQDAAIPMYANGNWDLAALISMISIGVLTEKLSVR